MHGPWCGVRCGCPASHHAGVRSSPFARRQPDLLALPHATMLSQRTTALAVAAARRCVPVAAPRALVSFFPSAVSCPAAVSRSLHVSVAALREQFNKDKANKKKKMEKQAEAKKKGGAMKDKASNVEAGDEVGISVPAMEEKMRDYVEHMRAAFAQIKAGRAVPTQLDHIVCSAHGQMVPLKAIGTVSARNAQTLVIQLYDPTLFKEVDKALRLANSELNPQLESEGSIAVVFPKMTREIRDGLVKTVAKRAEETRGHLRTIRQNYLQSLKGLDVSADLNKDLKNQIQASHDVIVIEVKKLQEEKEKEIQQV